MPLLISAMETARVMMTIVHSSGYERLSLHYLHIHGGTREIWMPCQLMKYIEVMIWMKVIWKTTHGQTPVEHKMQAAAIARPPKTARAMSTLRRRQGNNGKSTKQWRNSRGWRRRRKDQINGRNQIHRNWTMRVPINGGDKAPMQLIHG